MWIFASVVLLVIVFLAVRYPAQLKGMVTVGAVVLVVLLGIRLLGTYIQSVYSEKKLNEAKTLIKPSELSFTNMRMKSEYGSHEVRGNVTNKSARTLDG